MDPAEAPAAWPAGPEFSDRGLPTQPQEVLSVLYRCTAGSRFKLTLKTSPVSAPVLGVGGGKLSVSLPRLFLPKAAIVRIGRSGELVPRRSGMGALRWWAHRALRLSWATIVSRVPELRLYFCRKTSRYHLFPLNGFAAALWMGDE